MSARCLSTLDDLDAEGFSPAAQRALFGEEAPIPHQLSFARRDVVTYHRQHVEQFSISGVQVKVSLRLHQGELVPTDTGGEFILKPVPSAPFERMDQAPANEHLTMQLASQVFDLPVAANGLVRLSDRELAYLTRRFDRTQSKHPVPQEDLAQVLGRSSASHGSSYKYDGSYEAMGDLLRAHVADPTEQLSLLFRQLVFNYAVSNGDAHLKNFSLFRAHNGTYRLTPAYDLMCTRLHLPMESRLALDLFDTYESPAYLIYCHATGACFRELGKRYGLPAALVEHTLTFAASSAVSVERLVQRSFLSDDAKALYIGYYADRLRALALG